jgi:hypothetical protein
LEAIHKEKETIHENKTQNYIFKEKETILENKTQNDIL